jgi:hypothetical protein
MIPNEAKGRATAAALFAVGLLVVGVIVGLAWVNAYTPR